MGVQGLTVTSFLWIEMLSYYHHMLVHKMSYLINFENFHFFSIFNKNYPLVKKSQKSKFSKLTKYDILWSKFTQELVIVWALTNTSFEV